MTDISEIRSLIEPHGLVILGTLEGVEPEAYSCGNGRPEPGQGSAGNAAGAVLPQAKKRRRSAVARETPLLLVGNAGSSLWPAFAGSRENSDGLPHPMDRWSKRIGTAVAAELESVAVFPFDGPPYPPVLDWAKQAGQAYPSPISMFIHGKYGLWHAYRFALLLRGPLSGIPPSAPEVQPCLSCAEQPCLSACPVDAFADDRYLVDDCVAYLAASEHSDCRQSGCRARRACPFGVEFHYQAGHARFHMNAFLVSQRPLKI